MKTRKLFLLPAMLLALLGTLEGKGLKLKDLPPAVQKTVAEQAKGAEIKNISKEKEKGVVQYEVETLLNGKHRDFNVDDKGVLLVVEEEAALDSFPTGAKAAVAKAIEGGKGAKFEVVTKGGKTLYEAEFKNKAGKKQTMLVTADGLEVKE